MTNDQGTNPPLREETTVRANPRNASCDLSEEAVILSMETGLYHGLNEVGTHIWKLLQSPTTVGALRDAILEQFDVEREQCWQDLTFVLEKMRKAELIEIGEGDGG